PGWQRYAGKLRLGRNMQCRSHRVVDADVRLREWRATATPAIIALSLLTIVRFALRRLYHHRLRERAGALRERDVDAAQRKQLKRNANPKTHKMMQIEGKLLTPRPTQARKEGAVAGPPKPKTGGR